MSQDRLRTFQDLYKSAAESKRMNTLAPLEEQITYYALTGILTAYGKKLITKNEASALKAHIKEHYAELITTNTKTRAVYAAYQSNIKKAETVLTQIIKSSEPGMDFKSAFLSCIEVISMLEGQPYSVELKIIEGKLKQ